MAILNKSCPLCGKQSQMEWKRKLLRGNYNPTVKVRKYPNLQWVTLNLEKGGFKAGSRLKACTKCIKSLAKTR